MQLIGTARRSQDIGEGIHLETEEICSRHALIFGEETQKRISSLTIGIISAGGIGTILAEQLMRLFPRRIIIIDKDSVEITNLNRLVGANPLDARLKIRKVDVVLRNILEFNPNQEVIAIHGDFLEEKNQSRFRECDIILAGSDSVAVRMAANRLCLAHGIIYIDCGVGAYVEKGVLKAAGGQVIVIRPDSGFCLHCGNLFNIREGMQELLSDGERRRLQSQGYIRGENVVAPQVYSLNMMVAAYAIWVMMRIVSGEKLDVDGVAIDAKSFTASCWKEETKEKKDCPTCGINGIVFAGDDAELLVREIADVTPIIPTATEQFERDQDGGKQSTLIPSFEFYLPHYRGVIMGDESGNFLNIKVM
jgi:molybdopterin/thiamine biosynthesis adenylyltransferase